MTLEAGACLANFGISDGSIDWLKGGSRDSAGDKDGHEEGCDEILELHICVTGWLNE